MRDSPDLAAIRQHIRDEMGGAQRVDALHAAGRRTARDTIAALFDPDSFAELGTFAGMRTGLPPTVAGDGRVTGQALLDGRPVAVIVDDVTVKRATSTVLNARKAERVVHVAKRAQMPILFVGEAGGARLPEMLRPEVFASEPVYPWLFDEDRPPLVAAIVGESYGGSSFVTAMADISVMLRGSVLALTSPRVIRIATGGDVTEEELGGADVLAAKTDLIDIVVDDLGELDKVLRKATQFFSQPLWDSVERPDADIVSLVPANQAKVYNVRKVIEAVVDVESFLELGAARGRSIVTGLGRVDGRTVGVIASQPLAQAGALSPDACAKATRMTKLCDRSGFPILALVDTPGFQIGTHVEHSGMLRAAMELIKTNTAARSPVVTLILRKAFGAAFFAMFSPDHGGDVVLAWPDAQIGFMAPAVAANVLYSEEMSSLSPDVQRERLTERAAALEASSAALDVAAAMGIDEIIDKADTVSAIRRYLGVLAPRRNAAERLPG